VVVQYGTCGKYTLVPLLACRKASSVVAPREMPTVMFWVRARCGLKAAESWWKGFQSDESLYH
jgi:hypothetical protein